MRKDFKIISSLVREGSKILDVGCGDGELLKFLQESKNIEVRGIELDNSNVAKSIEKGLAVIQGDADNDLSSYPSNAIDYVILSNILQATKDPVKVLSEVMRIARYTIISVPNFGYWRNRFHLFFKGRMPVTKTLQYEWYETPNIHFCTIKDFIIFIEGMQFQIEDQYFTNDHSFLFKQIRCAYLANIVSENGIFLLSRGVVENDKQEISKVEDVENVIFARSSNYNN